MKVIFTLLMLSALTFFATAPICTAQTWNFEPADADTLRLSTRSGETLFFTLPDSVSGKAVLTYESDRLPALSWLVDRAFFWRTTNTNGGLYAIRFQATFANAPPEPVLAIVEVRPQQR